jgi:hypothetical protein
MCSDIDRDGDRYKVDDGVEAACDSKRVVKDFERRAGIVTFPIQN